MPTAPAVVDLSRQRRVSARHAAAIAGAMALLLFAGLAWHFGAALERQLERAAFARGQHTAREAARLLTARLDALREATAFLAARPDLAEAASRNDEGTVRQILELAIGSNRLIDQIGIVDASGQLRHSLARQARTETANPSRQPWFPADSKSGKVTRPAAAFPRLSPWQPIGPAHAAFAVYAVAPLGHSGGWLFIQHVLAEPAARADASSPPADGYTLLLDHQAQAALLSKDPPTLVPLGDHPLVQRMRAAAAGEMHTVSPLDQRPAFVNLHPAGSSGWSVMAIQPEQRVLAPLQPLHSLLLATVAGLLALLAVLDFLWRWFWRERAADAADDASAGKITVPDAAGTLPAPPPPDHRPDPALAGLRAQLEHRTAELDAANKEFDNFCASVSHDLRAPLRAIDGFSRMLVDGYSGQLDDRGRHLITVISNGAKTMTRLIDDLVAYSRLSRQPMQCAPVDMTALVDEVWNELPDRNAARLELQPLPQATGDRQLLRQIWHQLLANAVKFSRGSAEPTVVVSATPQDGEMVFSVRDNGAGFDMSYAHKLFGVFQRLHSPRDFPGNGIGLAIVSRIITRHGGRVGAEGSVGQGAAFWFTLPATPVQSGRGPT